MSLRARLVMQFAAALFFALGVQTLIMVAMTRQTVRTIVSALGGVSDAEFVELLLGRWQTVQWMYAGLNAAFIVLVWVWIVERTIVRPLHRLGDELERLGRCFLAVAAVPKERLRRGLRKAKTKDRQRRRRRPREPHHE